MTVFICLFEPKKAALKNGAIPLVIALEAINKKMASALAIGKLWEAYPAAGDNFADPKVCEDSVGQPRPVVGEFDEQFAQDNTFDGKVWTPNTMASAEDEDDKDEQGDDSGLVNYAKLGIDVKVGKVLMYDLHDIDTHELSLVYDLINDDEGDAGLRSIITALAGIPAIGAMYQESVKELIDAINVKFPKIPQFPEVQKFAQKWVDEPNKRDELTGAKKVTRINTPSSDEPIKRGFDHTYKTLDLEVALALLPADFNCWDATSAEVKQAKELMDSNDDAWRKWSTELRVRSDALSIPRETIFEVIRAGKKQPIFLTDATARKEFITQCLAVKSPQPAVTNLGDGKFSIDGLVGSEPQPAANSETKLALVANSEPETETKPPVVATEQEKPAQEPISDNAAQQAKETLDQLGYGVYASTDDKLELSEKVAEATQPTEATTIEINTDTFQQRATQIDNDISKLSKASQDNLCIWKLVQRTDPARTKRKDTEKNGKIIRSVTSINPTYQAMRATEIFGPFGSGWGVDIISEEFIPGIPFMEAILDSNNREIGRKPMRDGDGMILRTSNHTMRIELWYRLGEMRGKFTAFGHTKHIYQTTYGFTCDDEVSKKSLTDATTKALAQLGFSADVFMGMFDDAEYNADNSLGFSLKNASNKAEDSVRLRSELDDQFKANTETMRTAVTANEVNKICSTLTRVMDAHIKNAKAIGDKEYEKYLTGRLRRLNEIKAECLIKFENTSEKTS
ncbi:transcription termination factor [Yersinia kristensenii]|uniref:Transcription termination factor n=1 Tax=Yersinia kristensenii TaxID=28152 RepID=A0AB73QFN8_YERKR|nr:transcription termination factor [Yersinia kristensenii]OVZ83852.1 transcription termination factor [Yersinia kristensenii]